MDYFAIIATIVFLLTYAVIISEKINRTIVAIAGSILLLLFKVLTLEEAFTRYIHWETLGLLFGMFTIITVLSEVGFFSYLALIIARKLDYNPYKIFIIFPLTTCVLSAFMDSITVMLFFATLTYELSRLLKFDPIPFVVIEVVTANIGGSATLVGDPPNVILGLMLGFSFNDFVKHNGPLAVVGSIVAIAVAYFLNRKHLLLKGEVDSASVRKLDPNDAVKDWRLMTAGLALFGLAIIFLITHGWLEHNFHIPMTAPLAALLPAAILLILGGKKTDKTLHKIDYEVLLFFIGLFIVVGGLEKTHVISMVAQLVGNSIKSHLVLISTLMWVSAVASAIIDNVPFALSMVYVLKNLAAQAGTPALAIMVWATSLGTDIGGNGTPIGASANVVAYSAVEKHGVRIGWLRWMKIAIPPTVIALILINFGLAIKLATGFF